MLKLLGVGCELKCALVLDDLEGSLCLRIAACLNNARGFQPSAMKLVFYDWEIAVANLVVEAR